MLLVVALEPQSAFHLLIICQNNQDTSSVDLACRQCSRSYRRWWIIDLIIPQILVGAVMSNGSLLINKLFGGKWLEKRGFTVSTAERTSELQTL